MEAEEKENIKRRLATCLRLILKGKKNIGLKNKANQIEDIRLVESMRQLEAESGLSYTIIQNTSVGKRDIQFTTLINIIENLGYSFSEFAKLYDKVTDKQIQVEAEDILSNKRKGVKNKRGKGI